MVERVNQKAIEMVTVEQSNLPAVGIQSIHVESLPNHICNFLHRPVAELSIEFTIVSD
jgi:hypothetical protein